MTAPTLYLTSFASVAAVQRGNAKPETAACVGPGRVLSIMRWPRVEIGEAGEGRILALTPPTRLAAPALDAKKRFDAGDPAAAAAWRAYEAALRGLWEPRLPMLGPGHLVFCVPALPLDEGARPWDGQHWRLGNKVEDGATLICACPRDAARAGRCHRCVAADLLSQAGWCVVLDGRALPARAA